MTESRHRRIVELFTEAVEREGDARRDFLVESCGGDEALRAEVEAMLAADAESTTALDAGAAAMVDWAAHDGAELALPREFAGYELRSVLGRGGMATVFLAEQSNPRREVAIKLMAPGIAAGSRERFALEAELLGRLDHPGVAQVFEAGIGSWDGTIQPYFAMERVEGKPLVEFVRSRDLAVRDRVRLLAEVCDSVHHAHQKGVLHRDLKPSNILVTDAGRSKVLDFGIGRLLDGPDHTAVHTQPGMVLGTLAYMSPEQVEGRNDDVDTRADVYSLGVVLFEALSGALPIEVEGVALPKAVHAISTQEPKPLSRVAPQLPTDLGTITAKALAKDPERRYDSAAALAEDLRRFLANETVVARPATAAYRLRKFVARNRGFSAGVAVAVVTVLVATVVSVRWALEAEGAILVATAERKRAETEATANAEVLDFVEGLLNAARPAVADGDELTVRALVATGRQGVQGRFAEGSWTGARVQAFFGSVLLALGDYDNARECLDRGMPTLVARDGATHVRVLVARAERAQILSRADEAGAEALYREILKDMEGLGLEVDRTRARCWTGLAFVMRAQERFDEAEACFRRAMVIHDRTPEDQTLEDQASIIRRAQIRKDLASVYTDTRRFEQSAELLKEAAAIADGRAPKLFYSELQSTMGVLLFRQGKYEDSRLATEKALALAEEVLPPTHPTMVQLLLNLAGCASQTKEFSKAQELGERAVAIAETTEGVPPEAYAQALQNLGNCYAAKGDAEGAMSRWEKALAIWTELAGPDSLAAASLYKGMAWGYSRRGDMKKATEVNERAERIRAEAQKRATNR